MKSRVIFICKNRTDTYGNSTGLHNSAQFVSNFLNQSGIESKVVSVVDGNDIDRVVTQYNPSHVFIEALQVTPAKFQELLAIKCHQNRAQTVRLHSKISFIANEGIAFSWLIQYVEISRSFPNFVIAPNTPEFADDLKSSLGFYAIHLPNIYIARDYTYEEPDKSTGYEINIGCFGSIRPMKNHLTQAVAAINFANTIGKSLNFHINGERVEQKGGEVLKNLIALFKGTNGRHKLIQHPWMDHSTFMNVLRGMDIGMQVSFTETFNIVAADMVVLHIPIVVSKEIDWCFGLYMANPTSTESIERKLMLAQKLKPLRIHMLNNVKLYLYNHGAKSKQLELIK